MATYFGRLGLTKELYVGDRLFSLTRAFMLTMQADGNLAVYTIDDNFDEPEILTEQNYFDDIKFFIAYGRYTRAIWASGTSGSGAIRCAFQFDGNLVLYTADGHPVWATNTQGVEGTQQAGAHVWLQDDGNLVVLNLEDRPIWASNTYAGPR